MKYQSQKKNSRRRLWIHISCYMLYVIFLLPLVVSANGNTLTSTQLLNRVSEHIINPLIFVLFAAAFAVFIWGLVQFVGNLDNEESRSQGVKHIIWGIVGMVIMVSVNGVIAIIANTVIKIGGGGES